MTLKDFLAVVDVDADVVVWTKGGKRFTTSAMYEGTLKDKYLNAKIISVSAESEPCFLYFYVDIDAE